MKIEYGLAGWIAIFGIAKVAAIGEVI